MYIKHPNHFKTEKSRVRAVPVPSTKSVSANGRSKSLCKLPASVKPLSPSLSKPSNPKANPVLNHAFCRRPKTHFSLQKTHSQDLFDLETLSAQSIRLGKVAKCVLRAPVHAFVLGECVRLGACRSAFCRRPKTHFPVS